MSISSFIHFDPMVYGLLRSESIPSADPGTKKMVEKIS